MSEIPIATALVVIRPEGPIEDATAMLPEVPTVLELRAVLDPIIGGCFERISIVDADGPRDMFGHECGAIDGLPVNPTATRLFRAAHLSANPGMNRDDLPEIYGTVVLFQRTMAIR
jgi:hypothetical protein